MTHPPNLGCVRASDSNLPPLCGTGPPLSTAKPYYKTRKFSLALRLLFRLQIALEPMAAPRGPIRLHAIATPRMKPTTTTLPTPSTSIPYCRRAPAPRFPPPPTTTAWEGKPARRTPTRRRPRPTPTTAAGVSPAPRCSFYGSCSAGCSLSNGAVTTYDGMNRPIQITDITDTSVLSLK